LETGRLRYITETGAVIERDGSPVTRPPGLSPACAAIQASSLIEAGLVQAQQDLLDARSPGEEAGKGTQTRALQQARRKEAANLQRCRASQPTAPVPLTVSLSEGCDGIGGHSGDFPARAIRRRVVRRWRRTRAPARPNGGDLGADTIYAVSAFTFEIIERGGYDRARLFDIVERSVEDIMLNEVGLNDLRVQPRPGAQAPRVHLIAPDEEIHNVTTIDPGLIKINRDYGWMRAADVLDGVDQLIAQPRPQARDLRRWALATEIAKVRKDVWDLENRRHGHESPTRLADGTPPPDPSLQSSIDTAKTRLTTLIDERTSPHAGGAQTVDPHPFPSAPELLRSPTRFCR
jgi:NTE family protein